MSCPNPGPGNRDIGGGPIAGLILIFVRDRPDGDPCVVGDGVVQRAKLTGSHRLDLLQGLPRSGSAPDRHANAVAVASPINRLPPRVAYG